MSGVTDTADGFEAERARARGSWTALAPHRAGVYLSWLMEEGEERVREAYRDQHCERLRQ